MQADIPMKRILQIRPQDWVSFIFSMLTEIKRMQLPTDKVPRAESWMDNLTFVNDEFIFHMESNGYLDRTLPYRVT